MKQIINQQKWVEKLKYIAVFITIVTLSGCGLKGPLYETPTKPINQSNSVLTPQVTQE